MTKSKWPEHVGTLTHAYNCTRSNATGYSPFFLMFGRNPLLPIDLKFNIPRVGVPEASHDSYVKNFKQRMAWCHKVAQDTMIKETKRAKTGFDRNAKACRLEPGDIVLVRQKAFKGKHKIQRRWENNHYKVIERIKDDLPVYKVEGPAGTKRILHRNLLFPLLTRQQGETAVPECTQEATPPEKPKDMSNDVDEAQMETSDTEEQDGAPQYTGPMTRARAKQVLQKSLTGVETSLDTGGSCQQSNSLRKRLSDRLYTLVEWLW